MFTPAFTRDGEAHGVLSYTTADGVNQSSGPLRNNGNFVFATPVPVRPKPGASSGFTPQPRVFRDTSQSHSNGAVQKMTVDGGLNRDNQTLHDSDPHAQWHTPAPRAGNYRPPTQTPQSEGKIVFCGIPAHDGRAPRRGAWLKNEKKYLANDLAKGQLNVIECGPSPMPHSTQTAPRTVRVDSEPTVLPTVEEDSENLVWANSQEPARRVLAFDQNGHRDFDNEVDASHDCLPIPIGLKRVLTNDSRSDEIDTTGVSQKKPQHSPKSNKQHRLSFAMRSPGKKSIDELNVSGKKINNPQPRGMGKQSARAHFRKVEVNRGQPPMHLPGISFTEPSGDCVLSYDSENVEVPSAPGPNNLSKVSGKPASRTSSRVNALFDSMRMDGAVDSDYDGTYDGTFIASSHDAEHKPSHNLSVWANSHAARFEKRFDDGPRGVGGFVEHFETARRQTRGTGECARDVSYSRVASLPCASRLEDRFASLGLGTGGWKSGDAGE